MTVPAGKKIVIGGRVYKSGEELPKDYKLKEKTASKSNSQDKK